MIDLTITPADGPEVQLAKATLLVMRSQLVPPEVQAEAIAIMYAAVTAEACIGKSLGDQSKGIASAVQLFHDWLARMRTAMTV